ncbi:hypothetical protein E2320_010033, partial [Naja naja]
MFECCIIVHSG